jgi:hypothetical protein
LLVPEKQHNCLHKQQNRDDTVVQAVNIEVINRDKNADNGNKYLKQFHKSPLINVKFTINMSSEQDSVLGAVKQKDASK